MLTLQALTYLKDPKCRLVGPFGAMPQEPWHSKRARCNAKPMLSTMGKCAPLQAWQPEQWRALTTKRNISLLTDELLRVTLNTFQSRIYVQICGLIKKKFIIYYLLFILMGIFLKHLWLIPNILQWQDCKILIKLVSSQTLPEAATRGVLLKKVFLKMSIDTHEGEIFKP